MPTFAEIIEETCELLRQTANRQGMVSLSPEVAALFQAAGQAAPQDTLESIDSETSPSAAAGDETLDELAALVAECTQCGLHRTRKQTVFGVGNPHAELVFVGEAPGADEDAQGIPFVGKAGQLLTDIIEKGMKLRREDVYICNVLKCRPPDNRNPSPEEVHFCEPFLIRQLEMIRPKVICALGAYAAQTLLRTEDSVGRLRGNSHSYHGIPLRVTYHTAYLLRSPGEKGKTWEDVKEVLKVLNGELPKV